MIRGRIGSKVLLLLELMSSISDETINNGSRINTPAFWISKSTVCFPSVIPVTVNKIIFLIFGIVAWRWFNIFEIKTLFCQCAVADVNLQKYSGCEQYSQCRVCTHFMPTLEIQHS